MLFTFPLNVSDSSLFLYDDRLSCIKRDGRTGVKLRVNHDKRLYQRAKRIVDKKQQ